jgi:hypothetical protein
MLYACGFERAAVVIGDLYEKVRSGELGSPPADEASDVVRAGWL